jgi:hypothetical protein
VAVHAAWRTDVDTAVAVVLAATRRPARTPEPLRRARTAARVARARFARARGVGDPERDAPEAT